MFTTKLLDARICVSFQNILSRHSLPLVQAERSLEKRPAFLGQMYLLYQQTSIALRAQSAKLFLQFACQKPSNSDFGVRKVFCFMYITNKNHQGNALFEFALMRLFDVGFLYETQARIKCVTFLPQPLRALFISMSCHTCCYLFEKRQYYLGRCVLGAAANWIYNRQVLHCSILAIFPKHIIFYTPWP